MTGGHMDEITEPKNDIYGTRRKDLEDLAKELTDEVDSFRKSLTEKYGDDPIEHVLSRIKSDESMREKLSRKGLAENSDNALYGVYDAIGMRIVCSFLKDVYAVRDHLASLASYEVVK